MRFNRDECVFDASIREGVICPVPLLGKGNLGLISVKKAGFLVLFAKKDVGCSYAFKQISP